MSGGGKGGAWEGTRTAHAGARSLSLPTHPSLNKSPPLTPFVSRRHMCMTMRGVEKPGALTVSSAFTGAFKDDRALRTEFFAAVRGGGGR
jgi:hypothetical protein